MVYWQSELVKRYGVNAMVKDDSTVIVNKTTFSDILFDKIVKGKDNYSIETVTPKGERKNLSTWISIRNYIMAA